jgi:hypothetical protein
MFKKLVENLKINSIKSDLRLFSDILTNIPEINITNEEYNNTHGAKKDFLDKIGFYSVYGSFYKTFCIELISQLIYIVTYSKNIEKIPLDVTKYIQLFFPMEIDEKNIFKYYNNGWGETGKKEKYPFIFELIARIDILLNPCKNKKTLTELAANIFEDIIKNYLTDNDLHDNIKILDNYIINIKLNYDIIKMAMNVYFLYMDLSEKCADVLLGENKNNATILESMDSNGEVTTAYTNTFEQNIISDIYTDIGEFCIFVFQDVIRDKKLLYNENIYFRNTGIFFIDEENFLDKYIDDFTSKLPDSMFVMLQADKYSNGNSTVFFDSLLSIYKEVFNNFMIINKTNKNTRNNLLLKYFAMLNEQADIYRKKDCIDEKIIKKFDKYCDFVDNIIDMQGIMNKLFRANNMKPVKINYTVGYEIENDLIMFLLYLSSYNNVINNISITQEKIFKELFGKFDIQKEVARFYEIISDEFKENIPISFIILLEHDLEGRSSETHYSEILYNFYKDIGEEYLKCICKYENANFNIYHRYMRNIYKHLSKYLNKVIVMSPTQAHYSKKALDDFPSLADDDDDDDDIYEYDDEDIEYDE